MPFSGVHFSNELVDAMPVHLIVAAGAPERREWHERLVERTSCGFTFVHQSISDPRLQIEVAKIPPPPEGPYETEINLAALDWIDALAPKLVRGVVLVADYGFPRHDFYVPGRRTGTLQCYSGHRLLPSPLEDVGDSDITAHVEWTNLAERAERRGLRSRRLSPISTIFSPACFRAIPISRPPVRRKAALCKTLLHPEFLGTKFQFLALTKGFPAAESLGGFKFARDSRQALGLE